MRNRKIRVLIITSMPWRDDNNIGNSYSNIFAGVKDKIEFAHIYCRSGMPQNSICHRYFQIDESKLFLNIKNRKNILGKAFYLENPQNTDIEEFSPTYNRMRIMRWEIFFLARNILWSLADWKNKQLDNFVEEFEPDVMFGTLTYMPNINQMMIYISRKYNLPLFIYSWDDVYSLKQFSLSPIYWIRRFSQRKWIRKSVKQADKLYAITELMQKEYSKYFEKPFELLYKGYSYQKEVFIPKKIHDPIKFVFMGNLGAGRWKTLAKMAKELDRINRNKRKVLLNIYTLSPLSKKMKDKLCIGNTSRIMPVVPNDMVMKVLQGADILVHIEPLSLKNRLFYRLSFSTKLVDYFKAGKCIIGFGKNTASLKYIEDNQCGIVINHPSELKKKLVTLIDNSKIITEYSKRAWLCGFKNHQIEPIQEKLISDFLSVMRV